VYHKWQGWPGGAWTDWASLGEGESFAVASNYDGRLELISVVNGGLRHYRQLAPNGSWTMLIDPPPPGYEPASLRFFGRPALAPSADGRRQPKYHRARAA
jgi:hypothetical protein